jgi:hypothetical protein
MNQNVTAWLLSTLGGLALWAGLLLVATTPPTASAPPVPADSVGCGIKPIKPIPPVGCKDLKGQCVCDQNGHCWWEWVCVPE